jgi:hypothetical protein
LPSVAQPVILMSEYIEPYFERTLSCHRFQAIT